MSERKHADLWRELVDDVIDDAANVSVAQAEAELTAAGFDVAAERAKATAFLDALESETSSPTAKETPPSPAEKTRRKRPRARVVWLAAAASLAAAGGTLYAVLQPELPGHPAPSTTSHPAPVAPSATDLAMAADLRRKAAAACDAKQWSDCLAARDGARAGAPAGDEVPAVESHRANATAGRHEQR